MSPRSLACTLIRSRRPRSCTKHPWLHMLAFGRLSLRAPALVCTLFCLCTCCQSIISTLISYFVLTFVFHLYRGFKCLKFGGPTDVVWRKWETRMYAWSHVCVTVTCVTQCTYQEKNLRISQRISHWNEVNETGHVVVAKQEMMSWQVENIARYVLSLGQV